MDSTSLVALALHQDPQVGLQGKLSWASRHTTARAQDGGMQEDGGGQWALAHSSQDVASPLPATPQQHGALGWLRQEHLPHES